MERLKLSRLEQLLHFPGSTGLVPDASVLSCGCLVSAFQHNLTKSNVCGNCHKSDVYILAEVEPLRELYQLIQSLKSQQSSGSLSTRRRRSSAKKSVVLVDQSEQIGSESLDLLTLFYKYAREEENLDTNLKNVSENAQVDPISINPRDDKLSSETKFFLNSKPQISPELSSFKLRTPPLSDSITPKLGSLDIKEASILSNLNEEKEYNFSKCFPFHRKLTTYPTQQLRQPTSSNPFKGAILRRNARYISSCIHTYPDIIQGLEITKFVLVTEESWELYDYVVPTDLLDTSSIKPRLIACGKSNGEYGSTFKSLHKSKMGEFIVKPDSSQLCNELSDDYEPKYAKLLNQWQFYNCQISKNYLILSGSNGVVRLLNVNSNSPYEIGQPIYTYFSEYPIRCIRLSPNDQLIATSITAIRDNAPSKEQPFIILHKLEIDEVNQLTSISRISISLPSRDPIKQINFNPSSSHVICSTAWENLILIIKLKSYENHANYRKPRLIFSGKVHESEQIDDDLIRATEGITSIQFGMLNSNNIFVCSSTLETRGNPPMILKLDGPIIDSKSKVTSSDNYSIQNSFNSLENEEDYSIRKSEVIRRFPEVGSLIHNMALSPRGDGVVFLSKDGHLYLISIPNVNSSTSSSSIKQVGVLLGEVSGAERYQESASINFSSDGAKIFAIDRKGIFSVFDFAKGVPGQDLDVVRCKILNTQIHQ